MPLLVPHHTVCSTEPNLPIQCCCRVGVCFLRTGTLGEADHYGNLYVVGLFL